MPIEGSSVYDSEVMELVKKLQAEGVLLIVINGNKNKNPIEYASALTLPDIPRAIRALGIVADQMKEDLAQILTEKVEKNNGRN